MLGIDIGIGIGIGIGRRITSGAKAGELRVVLHPRHQITIAQLEHVLLEDSV